MFDFNGWYNRYSAADDEAEKLHLLEELKTGLYFNYKAFFRTDVDTASDFFCSFFPTLNKVVDNYIPKNASFFTYLKNILHFKFLSFLRMSLVNSSLQKIGEKYNANLQQSKTIYNIENHLGEDFDRMTAQDCVEEYSSEKAINLKNIIAKSYSKSYHDSKNKRQIERVLLCLYGYKLSASQLNTMCKVLDIDSEVISKDMRIIQQKRLKRIYAMKFAEEKVNASYCKFLMAQNILENAQKGSWLYTEYSKKIDTYKAAWEKSRTKFLETSDNPMQSMLEDVLQMNRTSISRRVKKIRQAINTTDEEDE